MEDSLLQSGNKPARTNDIGTLEALIREKDEEIQAV